MRVSIHCVTFSRDFRYLVYMLRSVEKFASGFYELAIHVPTDDRVELNKLLARYTGSIPVRPHYFDEWSGKGFLHHEYLVMCADLSCSGEFILHMDADHVFKGPVTPANYFTDGKPDIIYQDFETLIKAQPNFLNWQNNSERAMGTADQYEFMRRAPLVHSRDVYPVSRKEIEAYVHEPLDSWVRKQRNAFPQGFCEYQSVGSTAWRKFHDRYNWIRQGRDPWRDGHIHQAWSNRPPTSEDLNIYTGLGIH